MSSYLKAKPQLFKVRSDSPAGNDYGTAVEERKARTGFLQALLGKHPLHFMLQHDTGHTHSGPDSVDSLSFFLFDSDFTLSNRETWVSRIERDLDPTIKMNSILTKIIKESTKPVAERSCSTETINLIAFGGHSAHLRNGSYVVSRKEMKRLSVSDIVSQHTADFLLAVYSKYSKDMAKRELPES